MYHKFRKMIVWIIAIAAAGMLSGCSSKDQALFDGIMKGFDIYSYEDTINMKLDINIEGIPQEQMAELTPIINMINGADLTIVQKVASNKEKTDVDGQFDCLVNMGGMSFNYNIWLDSGFKNGEYRFKEILRMPSAMAAIMQGKEYMVIDSNYLKASNQMNYSGLMQSSLKMNEQLKESLIKFAKDYSFDRTIVKYAGTGEINGEPVKIYEMTLDDQLFKEWVRYTLDLGIQKDYILEMIYEYVKIFEDISGATDESQELLSEISDIENEIGIMLTSDQKAELSDQLNGFFDKIKDIPIIGDKGFSLEYKINNNGYIVGTSGNLNFVVDIGKWSRYNPDIEGIVSGDPIINLNLRFDESMTNINQNIAVEFPKVDFTNSIDIADMDSFDENRIKVYLGEDRVYFDTDPVVENGKAMLPIKGIADAMGMNTVWDSKTKTVTAEKEGMNLVFKINDDKAFVNGIQMTMDRPAKIINGSAMIPASYIRQCFNADIAWDQQTKTIIINMPE